MTASRLVWWLTYGVVGALALYLIGCVALGTYRDNKIAAACVRHGYPEHRSLYDPATMRFTGYCLTRVLQSDYMVPLAELDSARGGGR